MTAIVGLVENGNVYLGGDSYASNGNSIFPRADRKLFVKGPYAIGFAGSFRAGQILRHQVSLPLPTTEETDLHSFMVRRFIPAVRRGLRSEGFEQTEDSTVRLLIGVNGRLFCMEPDFQVAESAEPFAAIGSGYDLARASLHTSFELCSILPARHRLEAALRVTSSYCSGVGPPFHFVSVKRNTFAPNPPLPDKIEIKETGRDAR